MRSAPILITVLALSLPACGSGQGAGEPKSTAPPGTGAFDPPPPPEGFTRITAQTVHDVPPGSDITYCQYAMVPFDHDIDVLGVSGYQSKFGHHAVAFTYTPRAGEKPGSSFPCMGTEFSSGGAPDSGAPAGGALSMGAFLGGIGGAGGGVPSGALPEGVAFRLKKGDGVMLNVHYLNTGEESIDGNAVVDFKFADADPSRKIASMFVNLNFGFTVAPDAQTTSSIDCVAQSDLQIIMMANHMHEFGTSASTELVPAGSTTSQMLREDTTWAFDMQFNPVYTHWPAEAPLTIHAGDTVRTTCNWANTTANSMTFPREMCLGVGFALAPPGTSVVPMCAQGNWIAQGI
jgi:hypothetical protein